jgi:hypothetical protein
MEIFPPSPALIRDVQYRSLGLVSVMSSLSAGGLKR